MPTFSVVIPTFNRAQFVVKAIESVLCQTCADYEIIIIDDGSTDATCAVLAPYMRRIRYQYQDNAGVSAARNAGIKASQGQWIAFLDSDDEWLPDRLQTVREQINVFPRAVVHISNAVSISLNESRSEHFKEIHLAKRFGNKSCLFVERPLRTIVSRSHWFLQATVVRRNVLLRNDLLDVRLTIAEDLDLIARLALAGPFAFGNRVLVEIFRRNEVMDHLGSQCYKNTIGTFQAFGNVYENLLRNRSVSLGERCAILRALSSNRRALANVLLASNEKGEARYLYRRAVFIYPSVRSLMKYLVSFLPLRVSMLFMQDGIRISLGKRLSSRSIG
jgi:glycosyltransferase involved in cell wall biosynthesis